MQENSEIRMPRPHSPGHFQENRPGDFPAAGFPGAFPGRMDAAPNFAGNSPANLPGSRMREPSPRGMSWGIPRAVAREDFLEVPKFPGRFPGNFPGFGISREIPREVGSGSRLPVEFPGKSVAPDCGGSPLKLIAIKSRISARRRRSAGPQPQLLTRLEAIPASWRVGAGVSGPTERLGPPVPESARRFSRY